MTTFVARALALAAFRPGDVAAGDAALARIAGADGAAARTLLAAMHGADGTALVARVRREMASPRPASWRSIHPTWIEAAVTDGDRPHERWLARAFLGGFVPMPDPSTSAKGVAALVALEANVLAHAITIIGRRQIVHAFGRSAAQVAARVSWGREMVAEIAAMSSLGDAADRRLGRQKSALARTDGVDWPAASGPLRVGLRALAPSVRRVPELAEQIAQRLPRAAGQLARIDLAVTAPTDGVDDVEIARAIARASVGSKEQP